MHVVAEVKAATLETTAAFQNKHLIKAIAYYQIGDSHFFMFPWAGMGNLSNFWAKNHPETSTNYIWLFTQVAGLARAIAQLHHGTETSTGNFLHGNLKPENILCFKESGNPEGAPRLVITDLGSAKVHNMGSEWRNQTSKTIANDRYEAPELLINPKGPRSQVFDIWSFGCILLEFVIWQLYGPKALVEFSNTVNKFFIVEESKLGPNTIYKHLLVRRKKGKGEKVVGPHPMVEKWLVDIKSDWRCSHGTAMQRLFELIITRMLKEEFDDTKYGKSGINPPLDTLPEDTLPEEPTLLQPPSLTIAESSTEEASQEPLRPLGRWAAWSGKDLSITDIPRHPHFRADALEISEHLGAILDDLIHERINAVGDRPPEETQTEPDVISG